jgi:hypothetical protein
MAPMNFALWTLASRVVADVILALIHLARAKFIFDKLARLKVVFLRVARIKSASLRFVVVISASVKFLP